MITIAFRFDDPSETSNQEVEASILDALRTHRACCTFAVIPFRMVDGERKGLSVERAHPLVKASQEGLIEPALHGYAHVPIKPEEKRRSEFAGIASDGQRTMVREGRAHLESVFGMAVTGFVPPWNSYDITTLRILDQAGFKYLSAGRRATVDPKGKIKLLPFTVHLNEIKHAIAEARQFIKASPVIVVVMHHYDFKESGADQAFTNIAEFSNMLSQLVCQADIKLRTLRDVSEMMISPNSAIWQYGIREKNNLIARLVPKHSFVNAPLWRCMLAKGLPFWQ